MLNLRDTRDQLCLWDFVSKTVTLRWFYSAGKATAIPPAGGLPAAIFRERPATSTAVTI